MNVSIQRFFLLAIGFLFCLLGCTRDRAHMLMPDHTSHPTEVTESTDIKISFEQNVLPILTARCALSGCHVADGPHGLDFRTYASFIAGGEHGPPFIPGNAQESEIVEEIVEGKMPPPPREPLSDAEIQVIINWINQQEPHGDIALHDAHHDEEVDKHADMDDVHDEDMDDKHDDMDDAHDHDHDDDDHDDAHDHDHDDDDHDDDHDD